VSAPAVAISAAVRSVLERPASWSLIVDYILTGDGRPRAVRRHIDVFTKEGNRRVGHQDVASAGVIAAVIADRVVAALVTGLAVVVRIRIEGGEVGEVLAKIEKRVGHGRLIHRLDSAGVHTRLWTKGSEEGRAVGLANDPAHGGNWSLP
jgi:hypothetical protein